MTKKGFTLVELMVTVTIMMIMTAVVLFNYNRFNESTLLSTFAYDMSLTIRQAQVYGVAVSETPGTGQSSVIGNDPLAYSGFSSPYGVYFDSTDGIATPFMLFADIDKDGKYTASDGLPLQTYKFQRGIKIKEICYTDSSGGTKTCGSDLGAGPTITKTATRLSVTFKRPDPEAKIVPLDSGGLQVGTNVSSAIIYLENVDGTLTRSIVVESTGQISVK